MIIEWDHAPKKLQDGSITRYIYTTTTKNGIVVLFFRSLKFFFLFVYFSVFAHCALSFGLGKKSCVF